MKLNLKYLVDEILFMQANHINNFPMEVCALWLIAFKNIQCMVIAEHILRDHIIQYPQYGYFNSKLCSCMS